MWTRHLFPAVGALTVIVYGSALLALPDETRTHLALSIVMAVVVTIQLSVFMILCGKFSNQGIHMIVFVVTLVVMVLSAYGHTVGEEVGWINVAAITIAVGALLYMSERTRSSRECRRMYDRLNTSLVNAPANVSESVIRASGATKRQLRRMMKV
jgi:ABC-type multidrug transport system fused ATPase/permease subunit